MKMVRLAEPETFDVPLAAPRSHCETRLTRSKFGNCMKQILVFLLSYIGLITSVIAYAILGGVIFMALEGPNEELVKTKATTVRLKYIQDMYDAFDKMNVFHKENWTIRADKVLRRFQKEMYDLMTKEGLDGGELKETNPKWTFASSLLFAVTVITTIGNILGLFMYLFFLYVYFYLSQVCYFLLLLARKRSGDMVNLLLLLLLFYFYYY